MTQEETDQKEFEETYLHYPYDKSNSNERYDAVKYFFMESRRLLRKEQNKSFDFLDDKREDIYTEADGTKLGEEE
jgi:hypothetical protein